MGHEVLVLLSEVFGGIHLGGIRLLDRMRAALVARSGQGAARGFRALHARRISMAAAQGLGWELEHGAARARSSAGPNVVTGGAA